MNFSDIQNVLTVAEERSFTRAARRLYVSQSAVSQSIAKVERELYVRLFIRDNSTVRPTPICDAFVKYGRSIMSQYDGLRKEMEAAAKQGEKRLRIGTASFFFKFLTYHAEVLKRQKQFDFDFEIIEESAATMENMVINGEVDFCFTRIPLQQRTLEYEPLFTETVLLAVPADWEVCRRYPATAEDRYPMLDLSLFRDVPFVMINNPRVTPLCMQMCADAGYTPNVSLRTSAWEHVYAYVKTGNAVGFISCLHMEQEGSQEKVRFFRINSAAAELEHVVAYISRASLGPNARAYINELRNYIEKRLPV